MGKCVTTAVCLFVLLWGSVGHVAYADGEFVTAEIASLGESVSADVEVAGEQIAAESVVAPVLDIQPLIAPPPDVQALIVDAARRWGVDERTLLRIAWCESRFEPQARGAAGLAGIFQFAPITWSWVAAKAGYPGASPYDAQANIEAAAYLYKTEGPKHWGCK